jgi:3-dehydroquinate synthase
MLAAGALGVARGAFLQADLAALKDVIGHMGPLPPVTDLRISEALEAVVHDKKVVNGRLHFVLPTGIGSTAIVSDVHTRELRAAMKAIGMRA